MNSYLRRKLMGMAVGLMALTPPTIVYAGFCTSPSTDCPLGITPTIGYPCAYPDPGQSPPFCTDAWAEGQSRTALFTCCSHHTWPCGLYGNNTEGYDLVTQTSYRCGSCGSCTVTTVDDSWQEGMCCS